MKRCNQCLKNQPTKNWNSVRQLEEAEAEGSPDPLHFSQYHRTRDARSLHVEASSSPVTYQGKAAIFQSFRNPSDRTGRYRCHPILFHPSPMIPDNQ